MTVHEEANNQMTITGMELRIIGLIDQLKKSTWGIDPNNNFYWNNTEINVLMNESTISIFKGDHRLLQCIVNRNKGNEIQFFALYNRIKSMFHERGIELLENI